MRKRNLLMLACACALLFMVVLNSYGQDVLTGFTYQISFPTSNTKDFTNDVSFRGIGVEGRKMVMQNTSVGVSFDWNVFHTEINEILNLEELTDGEITGDVSGGAQNRITNAFPMLVTVHQYFGEEGGKATPFVGLGVGTYLIKRRFEIGVFGFDDNTWHFGLAPELGFGIKTGWNSFFYSTARYNYAFASGGVDAQSYFGIKIGVAYLK